MKKLVLLFVAVASISSALVSCSKNDDNDASIVGKWEFYQEGVKIEGEEFLELYVHDCATKKDYTQFFDNGTLNDVYYWDDCEEDIDNGTYTKSGNSLTLTIDGVTTNGTIKKLSGSTLKVEITDEGEVYVVVLKRAN